MNPCSRDAGTVLFVPRETQGRSFEHDGVAGVVREILMMHTVVETFAGIPAVRVEITENVLSIGARAFADCVNPYIDFI